MSHIHQDLHNAFPDDALVLRRLKVADPDFLALAARFDEIDAAAHAIEVGAPASDVRLEAIKKRRLAVLDDIAALVDRAKVAEAAMPDEATHEREHPGPVA